MDVLNSNNKLDPGVCTLERLQKIISPKSGQNMLKALVAQVSVMRVGSDSFNDPIFQKGLQN